MAEKFVLETATKAECLAYAERMLTAGLNAEKAGRSEKMIDMALNTGAKAETAAYDGRE